MPRVSRRMPHSGSSANSTSAIRLLVVGSHRAPRHAGRLADQTAPPVAPDEIYRPQRPAVGQRDSDAGVVPREPRHLTADKIGTPSSPTQPARRRSIWFCPQPEPVVVPGGKVAAIQGDPGEPRDLGHLPLRKEPLGDSTLIENLDGA